MIKINKVEYLEDKVLVNFNAGCFTDCSIQINREGYLEEELILNCIKKEIEYLYDELMKEDFEDMLKALNIDKIFKDMKSEDMSKFWI